VTTAEIVAARPISEIWVGLGGEPPKRGRARAFDRNGDNPDAVSLNDEKGCWYDFVTGEGGGILDLIQRVRGCDRGAALLWLSDFTGRPLNNRPLTAEERRQYARARQEGAELVAWKERLTESLKSERRHWWRVYHGSRRHILEHGLDSVLGDVMGTLYEISESEIDKLTGQIDTLAKASYRDLLPIFRAQRSALAA
jgi:hypothetical protein